MTCHVSGPQVLPADAPVILVGNPNVGKSVIFGLLTGHYVTVANYPGTTVEITRGTLPNGVPLLDTPGTNSLHGVSGDERVTADLLLDMRANLRAVVQVVDAKNLRRAMLLTVQLIELGVPLVINLNMIDEAAAHGVQVDVERLSQRLGVEIVTTVATRNIGLDRLLPAVERARPSTVRLVYDEVLEAAIERVAAFIDDDAGRRGVALRLLSGDPLLATQFSLNGNLTALRRQVAAEYDRPLKMMITHEQVAAAQDLLKDVLHEPIRIAQTPGRHLSRLATHPIWGWPLLALVLYVVYKFVGEFGAGTLVGLLEENLFGEIINPVATRLIEAVLPIPFLQELLVGEYGVLTMAVTYGLALVLPIVATFFLAFSILEDTGYLPRLAVMLNRVFKLMGLNGKAVLPMVLGLGCDTMATMSTRILETRKERVMVTLLLALGVPCSAQLGVILGMLGQVSATGALVWGGVVLVTMLAVGLLAARLLPGERSDFILELPPIRLPRLDNIAVKTVARIEWYLKEVLPLFIIGTFILFVLDKSGALLWAENAASPIISGLLGLPTLATGAFIIGFLRRDYGAAGLFALALDGQLTTTQVVVSLIVITLFIPCVANVLMIVKEYGWRTAAAVAAVVFPLAFAVGGLVNAFFNLTRIVP